MPVIRFEVQELERLLGKAVPRAQLAQDIPMLGADVDDVSGDTWAIEFFPDRPDLYTVEGIARALRAWYGVEPGLRRYVTRPSGTHLDVDPSVEKVRPHIAACLVRGVRVTERRLEALIDLQEDLHWGLGARRRRVAIGVHDLKPLKGPYRYTTVGLDENPFVPLGVVTPTPTGRDDSHGHVQDEREMTPRDILEKHPKGQEYAHLLAGHDRVPLIVDAEGGVLSMPPVINASRTTVTTATTDLFLDVTGTDAWAVQRALNLLATSLAESGGHLETMEIRRPGGPALVAPDLRPETRDLAVADANRLLGMDYDAPAVAQRLQRMGFGAAPAGDVVKVEVPPYRADVLHAVDLVEDVAIGHGINAFEPLPLRTPTAGAQLPESEVAEKARRSLVGLGFLETMGLTLSNPRDQFERMRRAPAPAVVVKNPVTEDHTMLRASLLPGLLGTLRKNAHRDLPQRLFEVGLVASLGADGRDRYERRVAGVVISGRSNFSELKGVVLALARDLGWDAPDVRKADDPAFVPGRCASLSAGGEARGVFGEAHPEALERWGLGHPVTAFEFHLARGPSDTVRGAK